MTIRDIRNIKKRQAWHELYREPIMEHAYQSDKEAILEEYKSIEEYMFSHVIDVLPVMTKNKYPYALVDGINHYVLWYSKKEALRIRVWQDTWDYVTFEHANQNKSIPNIRHRHIITTRHLL